MPGVSFSKMKIYAHNFNPASNSGPNKFTRQMFGSLISRNLVTPVSNSKEADVEFCLIQQHQEKEKPMILRLDGIYFNTAQDYNEQNKIILYSYNNADAVIFQSDFNKQLIEKWFGKHNNGHVIHNAPDLKAVNEANGQFWNSHFSKDVEVWSCASSWRPHKRLKENIRYFLEAADDHAIFAIAGEGATEDDFSGLTVNQLKRIKYLGNLDYISLLALYKRSTTFVHLSYLDHCPNVVVDAIAAGCHIVCASSGGTKELVNRGTIIIDKDWDYTPIALYEPPPLNFSSYLEVSSKEEKEDIEYCANRYHQVFKEVMNG